MIRRAVHMGAMGALLLLASAPARAAAPSTLAGNWLTEGHDGVVHVGGCGEGLCGEIAGTTGQAKDGGVARDVHGVPECHLTILRMQRMEADGRWHGTVTDPGDGKVYQAQMWLDPAGALRLRGYVGLPLFGSTQTWTRYTKPVGADCRFG